MKNKRLIIFLSIFVFLAVIVVLSSTVFSLRSVAVEFAPDPFEQSQNADEPKEVANANEIIESANFRYGESIFFVSKKTYRSEERRCRERV